MDDGSGDNSGVGGFADVLYWSSSEIDSEDAWGKNFFDGGQYGANKGSVERVRAIRAF